MADHAANPVRTDGSPAAARLKFITALVAGQPLILIPIGAMCFVQDVGDALQGGRGAITRVTVDAAVVATAIAGIVSFRYLPKYYRSRFGCVQAKEPSAKWFAIFLAVLVFLLFFGRGIAQVLDPLILEATGSVHRAMSDPSQRINLLPVFLWLIPRWWKQNDQNAFLFTCCGTLCSLSIALYPIWHQTAIQSVLWKALNAGATGLTVISWGVYYHITLLRLVPRQLVEDRDE